MVVVIGETLSPHGLCSVESPEQKAAVLPALRGFRWCGRPPTRWYGGHRQIVCRIAPQGSVRWRGRSGGSTVGFPCYRVVPGRGLCRTQPQAETAIAPLAIC